MNAIKQHKGFSLVELMVSITLSLVLLAGVLSIFFSSKVTYFSNEHTARLQENGRVALDLITHDLRASGYPGCMKESSTTPFGNALNDADELLWDYAEPLVGFDYTSTNTWTPTIADITFDGDDVPPADGSDILLLRTVSRDSRASYVQSNMASGTSDIVIPNADAPAAGQIMLISDCAAAAAFQVSSYVAGAPNGSIKHATGGSNPGNAADNLGYAFQVGARIVPLQTVMYYIGAGTDGPSLFRKVGAADAEEMVEGVDGMQVAFGEDTDADRIANRYVPADSVGNWVNVISVNVSLLMRSAEAGTEEDNVTYELLTDDAGGEEYGPFGDRRQRMLFTTTAAVRNRAL